MLHGLGITALQDSHYCFPVVSGYQDVPRSLAHGVGYSVCRVWQEFNRSSNVYDADGIKWQLARLPFAPVPLPN